MGHDRLSRRVNKMRSIKADISLPLKSHVAATELEIYDTK
jgi:hypothetical protein